MKSLHGNGWKTCLRAVVAAVALAGTMAAWAQGAYPNRGIRMVLGFAPGGGTDVVLRAMTPKLTELFGVSVVVDNKPGANGNIAAEQVVRAAADGYTLLYNTSSVILNPLLGAQVSFDVWNDLVPVSLTANIPLMLVVHPSVPVNNVREFVAYAKANAGKLNYASAGNGNSTHLAALLFLQATGISATHVPYKGGGPALTDTVAGQTQFYMDTSNTALAMVKDRRLKGLAVSSLARLPNVPDIPTLHETVASGLDVGSWSGVMAPARTPADVIRRANAEFVRALQDADVRAKLEAQSAQPKGNTPEQYAAFLRSEAERFGKLIRSANVKLD